jgi:FG-GAP-like repeat
LNSSGGNSSGVVGVQWTQVGPAPLQINPFGVGARYQGQGPDSGLVTDIAIDPSGTSDNVIYIGTDYGGVWKSTDGGYDWAPKLDFKSELSIGAVAVDPANPSTVYAGAGAPDTAQAAPFARGIGIYRSIDGGDTWSIVGGSVLAGKNIYRIVVTAAHALLVATDNGLYRSNDGGQHFGNNAPSFDNGSPVLGGAGVAVTDLHLDPAPSSTTVYAAVSGSGIFRSTDSGQTFPTNLFTAGNGAPAAPYTRISFAQSTQPNDRTMYASIATASGSPRFKGLYRGTTSDGTTWSWTRLAAADAPAAADGDAGCQCWYDLTVGVDPQDATRIYLGFQQLWLSTDGGDTFGASAITDGQVHWDNHALVFSPQSHTKAGPPKLYIGTDGGISVSADGGSSWSNINNGIGTNLLRGIDIGRGSASNNLYTYGGMQDTGTSEHQPNFGGASWSLSIDGDGGFVAVDPSQPLYAYGQSDGVYITTSDGGNTWTYPPASQPAPFGTVFRFAVDPNNGSVVYAGSGTSSGFEPGNQLFQSTSYGGPNSFNLMHTFADGSITSIATTKQDSNTLWVSLDSGHVWRTSDALMGASATWSGPFDLAALGAPTNQLSSIAVDPTDETHAVVVYAGFCGCAAGQPTKHVFMTTDNGAHWSDISGTINGASNLPDLPVYSVVIDPSTTPHSIIVSSDAGVARTEDLGATWQVLGVGLPTVDSTSLALDDSVSPALLRVGTYGRSTFELTSVPGPELWVSSDLGFGFVGNETATRTVKIVNIGSENVDVSNVLRVAGSTDFSITGPATPLTLTPGDEADYTVAFRPSSNGDRTATFEVDSNDPNGPNRQFAASGTGAGVPKHVVADFNGDGKTDISIFRPSTGRWYIRNVFETTYGSGGDIPVPADFNGDGSADIAIFRPSNGRWYIRNQFETSFGTSTDIPVPADFNGDGKTDIAIFRSSNGRWYVRNQFDTSFGISTDIPVPGDYDGDGKTDIAIFRPSNGRWYIRGQYEASYGLSTDVPVPGDYNGDGKTDIAIFRPSNGRWYIRGQYDTSYGSSTDIPEPGDYNGDGKTDIAIFRPSSGRWYIRNQSEAGWGTSTDVPLPLPYAIRHAYFGGS